MNDTAKERRRLSQTGVLDSAIRTLNLLTMSHDLQSRSLVHQALADLHLLRREIPTRRQHDRAIRK